MPSQGPHFNPDDAWAYFNQGNDDVDDGDHSAAIANFDQAIRLNPGVDWFYGNRALSYTALGMHADAKEDIEKALELGADRTMLEMWIESAKRQKAPP